MTSPMKENKVHQWTDWPQQLAMNEVWKPDVRHGTECGVLQAALMAAKNLKRRLDSKDEEIVVFYPRRFRDLVSKDLKRLRGSARIAAFRNVMVSATPRLQRACVAFLVKDVEAHRTPADAYFVVGTGRKGAEQHLEPKPLYEPEENFGERVDE